jgi:hypothetical protein
VLPEEGDGVSEFVFDPVAIAVWAKTSPELREALVRMGEAGVPYARSIAPVGEPGEGGAYSSKKAKPRQPGDYRDSLTYEIHEGRTRMSLRILSKDFKAGWVEKGTRKMPKYAVLSRTLDFLKSKL